MDRNTYRENVLVPLSPPFSWTPPFFRGQMDNPPFIIDSKNFHSPFSGGGGAETMTCHLWLISYIFLYLYVLIIKTRRSSSKLIEKLIGPQIRPQNSLKLVEACRKLVETRWNSLKLVWQGWTSKDEVGSGLQI